MVDVAQLEETRQESGHSHGEVPVHCWAKGTQVPSQHSASAPSPRRWPELCHC